MDVRFGIAQEVLEVVDFRIVEYLVSDAVDVATGDSENAFLLWSHRVAHVEIAWNTNVGWGSGRYRVGPGVQGGLEKAALMAAASAGSGGGSRGRREVGG